VTPTATITDLADRLNQSLEQLNDLAGADPSAVYYAFHVEADDLVALLTALARHRSLWDAFQSLLPSPDGLDALRGNLERLAREVGELDEAIEQAEARDLGAVIFYDCHCVYSYESGCHGQGCCSTACPLS
jgi:hypothetical protein